MEIRILKEKPITKQELRDMAKGAFGDLVKAVVDIEQGILALGGEFHADEEALLMEQEGSKREYTWGINLYPEKSGEELIEFDSVINLKPSFGNRTRGVRNEEAQKKIREIVKKFIQE